MDIQDLHRASRVIVSRNAGKHMVAAAATWDETASKLAVTFYFDRLPTDEDEDDGELAIAELIAEFSDIASVDSEFIWLEGGEDKVKGLDGIVWACAE